MKNIRDNRLKPCPFCGGCAVIVDFSNIGGKLYAPCCRKCGVELGKDYKTINGAIKAWNRRVE